MNNETLRMQMLAGIITESQYKMKLNENTLSRNVNYFSTKTNLKDPNLGTNQTVSSPFTLNKIINNLKPLIIKSGIYQGDPKGMASDAKEFENWLQSNMSKYDIFDNDSLTAREIFDQVYGDYIFEVNELNGEESGNIYNDFFQSFLDQELSYKHPDNIEDMDFVSSYKNKTVSSLDELIKYIIEIEDKLTEKAGAYPGEFYYELRERLVDLSDEENFSEADELLSMLDKNYEEED